MILLAIAFGMIGFFIFVVGLFTVFIERGLGALMILIGLVLWIVGSVGASR